MGLSHIGCRENILWVYIPQCFTSTSTRSAKVVLGLWVIGLHEKLTSLEPGTTCQAPYLFATRGKWFQLDDVNGVENDVSLTTWMVSMKCHGGKRS